MNEIWQALGSAFWLVVTLDADLVAITLRSLHVTITAVAIAALIGVPLGAYIAISRFRYRRATIAVLNALMGIPPVVVGQMIISTRKSWMR